MPDTTPKSRPARARKPRSSAGRARSSAPLAAVPDETKLSDAEVATAVETVSIADLFRKGRTIAQIARTAKVGQDAVRAALDVVEIDYSADPNAKPIERSASKAAAEPKEPKTWTLLGSYEAILAKPAAAAGSKRAQVVADLATDARAGDLQAIAEALVAAKDPQTLALRANALNAALSAHYARV